MNSRAHGLQHWGTEWKHITRITKLFSTTTTTVNRSLLVFHVPNMVNCKSYQRRAILQFYWFIKYIIIILTLHSQFFGREKICYYKKFCTDSLKTCTFDTADSAAMRINEGIFRISQYFFFHQIRLNMYWETNVC